MLTFHSEKTKCFTTKSGGLTAKNGCGDRKRKEEQVVKKEKQSRRNMDWDAYLIRKKKRQRVIFTGIFLVLILIFAGSYLLLEDRHYLLVSLLILGIISISFFADFEYRKPRAREIVLLATMTGFCVISNEICSHTLPLHAGTTMVVISGIAMGPEAGFLIGALSRLICNFFAGQGPWTPWQMAAWGLIGFLAGLVFNHIEVKDRFLGQEKNALFSKSSQKQEKRSLAQKLSLEKNHSFRLVAAPVICILVAWLVAYLWYLLAGHSQGESFWGWRLYAFGIAGLLAGCLLQRKKLPVDAVTTTVFTFVAVFLLYGGIMNFATMLMSHTTDPENNQISMEALKALYLTGAPYDAAHGAAAAFCMFLFGDSILQKLQRIQIKFGINCG